MQNTKTNEDMAKGYLANISSSSKAITRLREQISLIEYGLLKEVISNNPQIDIHTKLDIAQDADEKQEINRYLAHTVPLPMGYRSLAGNISASDLQEKLYASSKYLLEGRSVSDEKLEVIEQSNVDLKQMADSLLDRLDRYTTGEYIKGMVNPDEIQANINEGKPAFKKTSVLVENLGFTAGDYDLTSIKSFAVERNVGAQNSYANYNFPNNDPAFSVPHGNPLTAQSILFVAGDLHNKKKQSDDTYNSYKTAYLCDDIDAGTLAHMMNIKGSSASDKIAVVVVDVRSFDEVMKMVEHKNPTATTKIYTDTQLESLKKTNRFGQVETIKPVISQAIDHIKKYAISDDSSLDHALMIKSSTAGLPKIVDAFKQATQQTYSDNPHMQARTFSKMKDEYVTEMNTDGKKAMDALLTAFKGTNPDNKEDLERKLGRDTRLNARLNPESISEKSKTGVTGVRVDALPIDTPTDELKLPAPKTSSPSPFR